MIDHSILSPSGRVSDRAREAALERNRRALFGDGLPFPSCRQPSERERLLRQAAELETLADRGMSPVKHRREAVRLRKSVVARDRGY